MPDQFRSLEFEPIEQRAASTSGVPKSYSAVLSTEAPVTRRNYSETYNEVLSHDKKAIDLGRAPLPLIERHDGNTLPIGLVENVRIVDRKLKGEVRFGSSARAKEIEADVDAGIIRNLSVGYSIQETSETRDNKQLTLTATRWAPHEVSVIAMGADANAGFGRKLDMPDIQTPEGQTNTENTDAIRLAVEAERKRASDIRISARAARLDEEFTENLISSGASIDVVRTRILDEIVRRDEQSGKPRGSSVIDDPASGYAALRGHRSITGGEGLQSHHTSIIKDVVSGRMGALELARTVVRDSSRCNHQQLITRAMSTSDFPLILSGAASASLRQGFENEPATHRDWVALDEVKDFSINERPILGAAPDLLLKGEGGEYEYGALDEDAASYKIATYGRIVRLTRETLINDRLGAFLRLFPAMGMAARRKEADLVYSLFTLNTGNGPTMQDGNPLFHASHLNITAAGTFNAALLSAGRLLLRKMIGVGGGIMGLRPAALVCPAEREHDAELLLAAASRIVGATLEADVSPWIKDLKLVIEPRLAATAAFLVADSSQVDSAVLGLLEGQPGPYFEEKEEFETDNRLFKVRHDCGAKFLDWRGIVKMPIS